jgi:hypothetical protein
MRVEYSAPLSKGWSRMKKALFQPFDLGKWFTIGFTAFLAGLADFHGNGGGSGSKGRFSWDDLLNFPHTVQDWLETHPIYFVLIVIGAVVLFVVMVVFTWLSSRGKFMLLYNVVNGKSEISRPWHEYRKEGDSLFLWRFVFGLLATGLIVVLFIFFFREAKNLYDNDVHGIILFWAILKMIFIFLGYFIVVGYISLFLNDFVVPIMYKYRISATKGWVKFFNILWRYLGYFILYGLFIFILTIAVVIGILVAGISTCCLGFILLVIPYINAVILLPVTYTYRAMSLEFLSQFGEEYSLFPPTVENISEAE